MATSINETNLDEDSMLRPMMSISEVVLDNQEDEGSNELNSYSIWNEYRGQGTGTATPTNNEEDEEKDQKDIEKIVNNKFSPYTFDGTDQDKDMSMISRFAQRQTQPGTRDLAQELQQAKNEIFQLKLRIHCLEENQGLLDKKGSADSEENVYKVNIDLKVDILELREEIKEKEHYLREAITAIETLEKEKDQHRGEIEVLKRDLEELKTDSGRPPIMHDNGKLFQAFESMNLGAPSNDDENVKELREKISSLEGELAIERDHCQDLQNNLQQKDEDFFKNQEDLERHVLALETMKNVIHQKDAEILDAKGLLTNKETLIDELEKELQKNHDNISQDKSLLENLKEKYEEEINLLIGQTSKLKSQLDLEQNSAETLQERHMREMDDVRNDLVTARKALEEESETAKNHEKYLNLKLGEIATLMKQIDNLERQLNDKNEEIEKLQTGLDAVAQVTDEQSDAHIETMKELKRKNVMYDRLLKEYEIAKGKVRKYRSEKSSVSSTSAVALEDKYYLRQGANLALEKANQVYNQHLQKLDSDYISVLEVMQSRLEQLAICIEQILNNGLLEELSESMRDILQRSLNDSRRFSAIGNVAGNRTLDESVADMRPEVPHVQVTLDDLELELGPQEDYGAIIESLKTNHANELGEINQHLADSQNQIEKLQEKLIFIEDEKRELRIKLGNAKEKVKQLEEDISKLDKSRNHKLVQEMQQLKAQLAKEMAAKDDANGLLNYRDDELERLRAELKEANDKLTEYQQQKERVDKVLRHQLAKTHQVLKSTKTAMDSLQVQNK